MPLNYFLSLSLLDLLRCKKGVIGLVAYDVSEKDMRILVNDKAMYNVYYKMWKIVQ